ncbi:MAG: flagellar hook-basal body complex protein [Planctomycetes bacterium]|nr:flagellar hook-basal body complex protein [Planctomycetota bacterium]
MFGALRVGLTGLRANQRYLDVIGNNLTNSETNGFKADRLTFSDVLYSTQRQPTGPSATVGGVNARQFGVGVQVASIDQIERQGTLIDTGRTFDLALQGQGFFVLSNGNESLFSRVGSFTLDREANLVDSRTGFHVQNTAGQDIVLDTEAVAPAVATSAVTFSGNLPATISGPLAEIQTSSKALEEHIEAVLTTSTAAAPPTAAQNETITILVDGGSAVDVQLPATITGMSDVATAINNAFGNKSPKVLATVVGNELRLASLTAGKKSRVQLSVPNTTVGGAFGMGTATSISEVGTENAVTGTTALSNLNANKVNYVAGDKITLNGLDSQGQTVNSVLTLTGAETVDDLINFIQGELPNATVSLNADGKLEIEANDTGPNPLQLTLMDNAGNTGSSSWSAFAFKTEQEGTGPDTRDTSITVFDSLGIGHTLSGQFERQDDGTWNLSLTVPDDEGLAVGSPITGITFGPDGTFQGAANNTVDLTWLNSADPQTVTIDFGSVGNLSGLTQFGGESSAQASSQDGYESGTLASLGVTGDGTIQGFYTNGAIIDLDQVGVAQFRNNAGLIREGSTLFRRSDNSGIPLVGQAGVAGAGAIVAGALEGSNVDTAEEFVRLIEAQRSFQGSARIVTTADEIFAELLQIV